MVVIGAVATKCCLHGRRTTTSMILVKTTRARLKKTLTNDVILLRKSSQNKIQLDQLSRYNEWSGRTRLVTKVPGLLPALAQRFWAQFTDVHVVLQTGREG